MTATTLITRCRELGITLACGPEGKLRAHPASLLSDDLRAAITQQKAEVLVLLSPYINARGELIIPLECDSKYHYWKPGG